MDSNVNLNIVTKSNVANVYMANNISNWTPIGKVKGPLTFNFSKQQMWPMPLYESEYCIDNTGAVMRGGSVLKPIINSHGFYFYTIYLRDGRQKSILPHVEVYRNFIGPYPPGGIKHKDSNKLNNHVENLVACHPVDKYLEYIQAGISVTKIAAFYKTTKKEISKYVSIKHPGGIRDLRKYFPLNKSLDIHG